ncbi:SitI6 family double-CXXCG motif immunity protein [Pyxidicoccus xibeiensis]|uniref:SitI6 family double-CXXCG motif immunity protein n=1 Tax=Pyxidicoccus xibeiensis TaxID=2906759 RepID=UPI0020A7ED6E|nr:double-CXXCG motif protein [Pyxidicoccus xibeiensis]MCP3142322.1 double-CXXCG motif protein [Pyxidicoccus xibeiensis]
MSRFFWLREDRAATARYTGDFNAGRKWSLPGARCSACGATWSATGHQYPSVDLSHLPERGEFEKPRSEPYAELARLRERVRLLAPPTATLPPGTGFGPLVGTARGDLGPLTWQGNYLLLLRRDTLDRLQAEGARGLLGCRTELQWKQRNPPEFLELQIEPHGQLHPDCIPSDVPPPCTTCGRYGISRPDEPMIDASSLPSELDLFRVGNFATMLVGTERFMDAVRRLDLDGISFRELPTR